MKSSEKIIAHTGQEARRAKITICNSTRIAIAIARRSEKQAHSFYTGPKTQ